MKRLTHELIHKLFDYHEDGYLIWKIRTSRCVVIGSIAGGFCKSNGYFMVGIYGSIHLVHRIIFFWHKGYLPENDIDHIDNRRLNNRIENLREASRQCNARNSKVRSDNLSGVKGVGWNKKAEKWIARIKVNGHTYFLGEFEFFDDAVLARYLKEVKLNWKGCESTSSSYIYLKERSLLPKPRFFKIYKSEVTTI